MKVVIVTNNAAHQKSHATAALEGFKRHGINAIMETWLNSVREDTDVYVMWSIKRPAIMDWIKPGKNVLVMERGHVGERMDYTSCGWNGLAGRGVYPYPNDDGAKWNKNYSHLLKFWRYGHKGYALLIGQVEGDSSLYPLVGGFKHWAQEQSDQLRAIGYKVVYRPHPLTLKDRDLWHPKGATLSEENLVTDLSGAMVCVTFSSTVGVQAVLSGVPTVALDIGSMAYPVAAHNIRQLKTADRTSWAHRLAWTQWTLEEISTGEMWEYMKGVLDNGSTTETFYNRS